MEIERSEREKREKEAIEAVKKFETKQREVHDCIELKDDVHQKYLVSFKIFLSRSFDCFLPKCTYKGILPVVESFDYAALECEN